MITAWHFVRTTESGPVLRDGRPVVVGEWSDHDGPLVLCERVGSPPAAHSVMASTLTIAVHSLHSRASFLAPVVIAIASPPSPWSGVACETRLRHYGHVLLPGNLQDLLRMGL